MLKKQVRSHQFARFSLAARLSAIGAALILTTSLGAQASRDAKVDQGPSAKTSSKNQGSHIRVKELKQKGKVTAIDQLTAVDAAGAVSDTAPDMPVAEPVRIEAAPQPPQGGIAGPCPAAGSCFIAHATPGCDDAKCCSTVCACDPFCCETSWDAFCAGDGKGTSGCGAAALCTPPPCPVVEGVPNNCCEDAIAISAGLTAFSTIGATTSGLPHATCQFDGQTYNDIWFTHVATQTRTLTISTCGLADYDSDLVVYQGSDCGSLTLVGCNDDFTGCDLFTSSVSVDVEAGLTYTIRVGGWMEGDQGTGQLSLEYGEIPVPPVAYSNTNGIGFVHLHGGIIVADNLVHKYTGNLETVTFSIANLAATGAPTSELQSVSLDLLFWNDPPGFGPVMNPDTLFLTVEITDAPVSVPANSVALFDVDVSEAGINLDRPMVWAGIRFTNATFAAEGDISRLGQQLVNPPDVGQSPGSFWRETQGFVAFGGAAAGANFTWILGVDAPQEPCELVIPAGAIVEAEECGSAANNGCNATPNVFELVACDTKVHGTTRASAASRDTDWYELVVPADVPGGALDVTLTLHSEVTSVMFRMDGLCPATILDNRIAGHGQPGVMAATLVPGVHHIFVAAGTPNGGFFEGYPCGTQSDYVLQIDCGGGSVKVECGDVEPPNPCPTDLAPAQGDGQTNVDDLLILLQNWGPCNDPNNCPTDLAPPGGDDQTNVDDLLILLQNWGPCAP